MASADDVNSTLKGMSNVLGQWVKAFNGRIVGGTVTLANATTTVVTQGAVTASSIITFTPTGPAAALLLRTAGLYHSANAPGTSFSLSTQSGTAAGTETFEYLMFSPS